MVLHNQVNIKKPTTSTTLTKTNSEINIITYLNNRTNLNKNEIDLINRKRLIQMLDLFNSKYDCKICCRKLRYKADEIIHTKLKHNTSNTNTQIKCPMCELKFTSYFKLKFHLMKQHLNEKPYKCKECSSRFHSFLLLKKHCYKMHLNNLSLSSSLSSSSSSFNSTASSEKSFIDLIDYDNSNIDQTQHAKLNLLPTSTSNPLSVQSDQNLKYFHHLNKINKSKNIDSLIDFLSDSKSQFINNLNENTFTIITNLNVISCNLCSKLTYSNSDYLNHVWQEHLSLNKYFSSQFICWACVQANKNNPINTIDKFKFHTLVDLNLHCKQFKHIHYRAFKCSICLEVYFDDLDECKSHYLNEHKNWQDTKSYLDDIIDLATNLDSDNVNSLKKTQNSTICSNLSCKFAFACSKCEQIYSSYECIQYHFLTNCQNIIPQTRTKCSQCDLSFTNIKQIETHLKQHDYLAFNELINKKNIKYSKNNKSYSIDAIVSSLNMNQNNKRIDDIACKIMKKSQETTNIFNATNLAAAATTSFLFNIHQHQFPFGLNSSAGSSNLTTKKFNLDENLNQYNDLLTRMIKNNESLFFNSNNNSVKKTSAFYSTSSSNMSNNSFAFTVPNILKLDTNKLTSNALSNRENTNNNKQIKCDYCGYFFNNLTDLNDHKILHQALNPKRPFKCHLCQVTFAKTDQLTRHMIVHQASELDSVCQVCYSSFSRKQDLDRHMLFHSK